MNIRLLLLAASVLVNACAADAIPTWDGFRGHGHDGISMIQLEKPAAWPKKLRVVWAADIGAGYSSPITDGANVYLQERKGEDEFISAFDVASGKPLWKAKTASQKEPGQHEPACTPLFHEGALYIHSMTGVVLKLDARDGKTLWTRDFPAELKGESEKYNPAYGPACSPVIWGENILLQTGVKDRGYVAVLNRTDGKGDKVAISAPSYGTCMVNRDGSRVYVLALNELVGLIKEKETLRAKFKFELPGGADGNAGTPVILPNERVLLTGAESSVCVQINNEGKVEQVWKNALEGDLSTPVFTRDRIYLFNKSSLVCVDPKDGKTLHSLDMDGQYCAFLASGDLLFCRLHDGTLKVIGLEDSKMTLLADYPGEDEGSDSWSSVIPVGKTRLVMRGGAKLKCLTWEP